MKEININIEGYNVNGICVACLNYNRSMFYHKDVKECFKLLGNIDVPDGLSVQVCWECLARMKSVLELRSQMLWAYDCLIKYSRKHTFLDAPSDLSSNASQRLSMYTSETFSLGCPLDDEVKDEVTIGDIKEENADVEESKPEMRDDLSDSVTKHEDDDELQFEETLEFRDDAPLSPAHRDQASSDEDIQLSKLKTLKQKDKKNKKQRRGRVKKKYAIPVAPKVKSREEVLERKRELEKIRYQRIKNNNEKRNILEEKKKEYYLKRKAEGKIQSIAQLTPQCKRLKRQEWRKNAAKYREKKKNLSANTFYF